MSKCPTPLGLTPGDRSTLERWVRGGETERRLADRARQILAAAGGQNTVAIAQSQHLRPATVSKWRVRFLRERLDSRTRRDEGPPSGQVTWTGSLVAEASSRGHEGRERPGPGEWRGALNLQDYPALADSLMTERFEDV